MRFGSIINMSHGGKVTPATTSWVSPRLAWSTPPATSPTNWALTATSGSTASPQAVQDPAGGSVGSMDKMIEYQEWASSMKRCNTGEEVGDTAVYLLSELSSVTGETSTWMRLQHCGCSAA